MPCTSPSAPHTRPTQRLSRPPPIQKLGAENHLLQLNIWYSWWWAYVSETCRAKNTSINLRCCIKLACHFTSRRRSTVKQPSKLTVFKLINKVSLVFETWALISNYVILISFYFFYRLILNEARRFGSRLCLRIQVRKAHNMMDPLDTALRSQWTHWLRRAVYKQSTKLCVFLTWRGKHSRLLKRLASLKFYTMDKVQKQLGCYVSDTYKYIIIRAE